MHAWIFLTALVLLMSATACGGESRRPDGAPRTGSLARRDTPLAVGAEAPRFEGRPEGKVLVLFYRGHW